MYNGKHLKKITLASYFERGRNICREITKRPSLAEIQERCESASPLVGAVQMVGRGRSRGVSADLTNSKGWASSIPLAFPHRAA